MNTKDFHELIESVKEVGLTERGGIAPSREFLVSKKSSESPSSVKTFAICLSNEDEQLIPLKIYHAIFHPQHKTCTVKDESRETVVCPMDWFLPIEFSKNVEQLLEKTELALA